MTPMKRAGRIDSHVPGVLDKRRGQRQSPQRCPGPGALQSSREQALFVEEHAGRDDRGHTAPTEDCSRTCGRNSPDDQQRRQCARGELPDSGECAQVSERLVLRGREDGPDKRSGGQDTFRRS